MRGKTTWLDITVQFASFALMCLILAVTRFPLPLKIILAFGVSIAISAGYAYVKRVSRKRAAEPKRVRVYSVENVDD
ncbi:hypothetical protein [Specibacter cremeus]|uniref:hypothetical protein n=1 Tax=Specibacter cremeus TaxID=1629051 RepID=UPI000F79001E|nr:hypothetical protein [Specibacter cremeus]